MKVSYDVKARATIDVAFLEVTVPAEEIEHPDHAGKWPEGFGIDRETGTVTFRIDAATGKICRWPGGEYDNLWKVRDAGEYTLLDATGTPLAKFDDGYVPAFATWGESDGDSDYIGMKVSTDGEITGFRNRFTAQRLEVALSDLTKEDD